MPPVDAVLVEEPEPDAPYGVKGAGEPPTVVSTAAIVSVLRDATGRELSRVPVGPGLHRALEAFTRGGAIRPPRPPGARGRRAAVC